jgi:hypothetical protein
VSNIFIHKNPPQRSYNVPATTSGSAGASGSSGASGSAVPFNGTGQGMEELAKIAPDAYKLYKSTKCLYDVATEKDRTEFYEGLKNIAVQEYLSKLPDEMRPNYLFPELNTTPQQKEFFKVAHELRKKMGMDFGEAHARKVVPHEGAEIEATTQQHPNLEIESYGVSDQHETRQKHQRIRCPYCGETSRVVQEMGNGLQQRECKNGHMFGYSYLMQAVSQLSPNYKVK